MHTNDSYTDKMHDLFSELEGASLIYIMGHAGSDIDMFNGESQLDIVSVNKCKTPKAFGQHIGHVCQRITDRAMEEQADLKPGKRSQFIEEVNHYFGLLVKETLFEPALRGEGEKRNRKHDKVYLFKTVSVILEDGRDVSSLQKEHFRKLAFRYSAAWRRAIKESRTKLKELAMLVEYLPDGRVNKARAVNKIIVKSTAARLALLARIFFEIRIFATGNKRELVRCFTQNFGTVHKDDLSPVTFRNKFDRPDSVAIGYMRCELQGLLDILDKLEKRYS